MVQLMPWFWRQEYWLPPGITWEDMQDTEDVHYPQPHHLLLSLPIVLLLVVFHLFFQRKIVIPLSKKVGLQEKMRRKPSPNGILEAFYRKWRKNPQQEEVNGLAKQCDLQPKQVERWFRYWLNQDQSLTKEFCEISLGAIYYFPSLFMGLVILYDKPWFWDVHECWFQYPKQPLQPILSGYYLMQFSFYCYLVISLPFHDRQKYAYQQTVHHFAAIILIGLSYCVNCIRIGSLILLLSDISHCFLMATKLFSCLKWQNAYERSFLLFAAAFMFNHLVIFPSKILHNTYYYYAELHQPFFGYYFFNTLLMVMMILYISWSYLICLMIYKFLIHGMFSSMWRLMKNYLFMTILVLPSSLVHFNFSQCELQMLGKDVRKDSESSEDEDEVGQKIEQEKSNVDGQNTCQLPDIAKRVPVQTNSRNFPSSGLTKS